ncbi:hypothetical protein [Halarcobacter anaerophilus]|uniref:Uncharacterized protein n=1 Tax=Halarcobacter anaerophilus TaxID=877500 RepID=A0A4Q0Y305_9BACT|nr:hypothetical protein [Halarcobacter anaerophilus]QDF28979.1 hypothetical protein AANAER_1499 [Halarcobacter anaerophilus]RXJ63614.1 hypothetical protein CRV06_05320 [Halarcobacter anaerophilus]
MKTKINNSKTKAKIRWDDGNLFAKIKFIDEDLFTIKIVDTEYTIEDMDLLVREIKKIMEIKNV